ncbi:hypothetical protein L6452_42826 [Arctium lappa]|uniref:Uncharacterized protein n=1 Tax=Arctium lappa TaxID=4217 RepID=A0ACB8XKI1_ARCLA|nr:hypothetical protein L6452_42826 [Arctium lappa]
MAVLGYVRMWWCAAVIALLMAAGTTAFTSGEEATKTGNMKLQRRLLAVHLDDYGQPSANQGHDPRGKGGKSPNKRNF